MSYNEDWQDDVPSALYHATLGKLVLGYVRDEDPTLIQTGMESKAICVLEQIYEILNDPKLEDPECFQKIDAILRLFFRELELRSNRHLELD